LPRFRPASASSRRRTTKRNRRKPWPQAGAARLRRVICRPKNKQSEKIDGVKFEFYHWAPAHTSGDLIIYLPGEKIVFCGDIIAGGKTADPLIHLEKNGSSEGWITTVKGITALKGEQFVEGHGDVLTKEDVQKRLTDAETKRAKIKEMVGLGRSLDYIRMALGEPEPAATPGRGPGFPTFTAVVYQELTKKPA
jgi:glyoxylase-like metal-dependent hydrolase (beta-lactamase superfamily II)